MKHMYRLLLLVASAAFFIASSASAQNAGSVTNHAFAIGKGAGVTGYTSLLCTSAQLAVGQAAADPICRTITGDVTISAAGATAIGTARVTSAMLRDSGALSVIGRSANSTGVPGDISCTAASDAVLRESGSVLGCGTVATAGIANNAITDAKLRTSAGLSVIGRSASTSGNVADITGTADQIFRVAAAGASVGFGSIDLSKSAAVGASILALANGGCNAALTASNGGILWSNASQCQILAGTATARLPMLSGATATPVWGAYTLPSSVTSGGIPYFSSTSAESSSALLAANQIVLGGGAGVAPATLGSLGTTTTVLHGNAAGAPSFAAVTGSDMAANTVANGQLATMAANTVKANATGGSAAPTDVTAATARSSSLLNVDSFTGHGDSIYTILTTDRTVGTNAAFTASRTWTLPAASGVNAGQEIIVADFQGTVTASNTLVISRAGADTINGGTSVTITAANGAYLLKSDGSSKWTAQALGAAAAGGVSSVTCGTGLTGGTITTSGTCALSTPVSTANGGTGNAGGAWTAWTPTVTAGSGTPTTVSGTGTYQQIGKLISWTVSVTITTVGTAGSGINLTMPGAITAVRAGTGACTEVNNTGKTGAAQISGATATMTVWQYDHTTWWANGNLVVCSGIYEAT